MGLIGAIEYVSGSKLHVSTTDTLVEFKVSRPELGDFLVQLRPDQAVRVSKMLADAATKLEPHPPRPRKRRP